MTIIYLRRHVSLRADSVVKLNVDGIRDYVVPDGQSEIAYGAGTISLHEDIFWLQVPMSNGRLALRADYFHVKVR